VTKCPYCHRAVHLVWTSPYMADHGEVMCARCWEFSRRCGINGEGVDIGPFPMDLAKKKAREDTDGT